MNLDERDTACGEAEARLHPYLDGELDPEARLRYEEHLASCGPCAAAVGGQRALAQEIRQALACEMPADLPGKVARRVRLRIRHRRLAAVLTTAAALLLLGILLVPSMRHGDLLSGDEVRDLVELHRRSLAPGRLVEEGATDAATLSSWFRSRLDFTPWISAPAIGAFTLVGARLDWCDHQKVAALAFRRGGQVINLISYPADQPGEVAPESTTVDGTALCGWVHGKLQYVAVAELPADEVRHFSDLVRERTASD